MEKMDESGTAVYIPITCLFWSLGGKSYQPELMYCTVS